MPPSISRCLIALKERTCLVFWKSCVVISIGHRWCPPSAERGATLITSNLPFDEWTETLGSERLTGALLDRITHHVSILEMNGDSYRLAQSRARKAG